MHFAYCFLAILPFTFCDLIEDDGVLVLSKYDFQEAQKKFQHLFVEFHSPWCGHCKSIAPEFSMAANQLKEQGSTIKFAKVDASVETELRTEYNITGYPTFKFFLGNEKKVLEYSSGRHAADFVHYVTKKTGPPAQIIVDVEVAKQFAVHAGFVLMGFFKNLKDGKAFEEFVFDHDQYPAAITDNYLVFQEFGIGQDTIVAFKKYDEQRVDLTSNLSYERIKKFAFDNHLPLVMEFLEENVQQIFTTDIQLYSILFVRKSHKSFQKLHDEFINTAVWFRGKVIFFFVDLDEQDNQKVLEFFGIPEEDVPTHRFIDLGRPEPLKYKPSSDEITKESVESFVHSVLDGLVKPFYKSKEIPRDWNDNPVKVLVGKNFDDFLDSSQKNVIVLFYVPWCGICKRLDPIWEELGKRYQNSDETIVAKFDSADNELEGDPINSFPTIKLFLKKANQVIEYSGERTFDAFVTFIESGGKTIVVPERDKVPEDAASERRIEL